MVKQLRNALNTSRPSIIKPLESLEQTVGNVKEISQGRDEWACRRP
jgi:hypothetical protein